MKNLLTKIFDIIISLFDRANSLFFLLFQNSEISLFETNIRFMGSLLACYALTGDVMFRDKAAQLGERMLPAFQTETGIPHSLINLHTGVSWRIYAVCATPTCVNHFSKPVPSSQIYNRLEYSRGKGIYDDFRHDNDFFSLVSIPFLLSFAAAFGSRTRLGVINGGAGLELESGEM